VNGHEPATAVDRPWSIRELTAIAASYAAAREPGSMTTKSSMSKWPWMSLLQYYRTRLCRRGWQYLSGLCTASGQLEVVIRDSGQPFDPDDVPSPNVGTPTDLDSLNEGGLGLYFMRKLMDDVRFEFVPGQGNTLTMTKRAKTD
jgi:hypothetical protein